MSKKAKSLIAALVSVAILAGAMVGINIYLERTKVEVDYLAGVDQLINVVSGSIQDLKKITVQNPTDTYDVVYRTTDYGERVWHIEPLMDASPVSGSGNSVASACANINAEQVFEDVTDLAEYGLADPSVTVKIVYDDNSSLQVYLGSAVPAGGGYYLTTEKDKTKVYVLSASSSDVFFKPLTGFIHTQITGYDKNVISGISGFKMSGTLLEEPIVLERPVDETEIATLGFNMYNILEPVRMQMRTGAADSIGEKLAGMEAAQVAVVAPTQEQLEACGLKDPQYILRIEHPDWEDDLVLKTGKVGGIMYLMKNKEPVIYQVNAADVPWHGWQVEDLMSSIAISPRLGELSKVQVTMGDAVYDFQLESTIGESGTYEGKKIVSKVNLGDREMNLQNFQSFYQLMLNGQVDSRSDGQEPTGKPLFTFTYNYVNGGKDVVEFYSAANRRLCMVINGSPDFFVREGYYDKVVKELDNLMNDIQVTIDWN